MSDPFIGEIRMFGFNFAPRAWAFCSGQLLPISSNTTLFSLLGTYFGGDGRTTFALPDMQGRSPMSQGNGPGLSPRAIGQKGGQELVTLNESEMPAHTHDVSVAITASAGGASATDPTGAFLATGPSIYNPSLGRAGKAMAQGATTVTQASKGGNQAHQNMPPYTVVNFSISLQGVYPSRN